MKRVVRKLRSVFNTISDIKREQGTSEILPYFYRKTTHYLFFITKFILTLPIAFIIIALKPFKEIRFFMFPSSRIGHFSANPEFMLLSQLDTFCNKKKWYLFYTETIICNTQLLKMWKRVLPVLPFPRICHEINKTLTVLLGNKYKIDPVRAFEDCRLGRDNQRLLEKRDAPYIFFTPREIHEAQQKIHMLGVDPQKPFVCLLVRDAGYLDHYDSTKTFFRHHDARDADIASYRLAALFLAKKNYTVFRMGKYVKKPFDVDHPNVIDYANHPQRCDLLDIYLAAHCTFMISTSTGLDCITQLFRKPLLFTDLLPIFNQLQSWYPCALYIPKKIRCRDTKTFLTFKELEKEFLTVTDLGMQAALKKRNVEIIPNTEEEILDAVIEMESRVSNSWIETEDDENLQKIILTKHFPSTVLCDELRFKLDAIKVKIGKKFLQENISLFVS